MKNKRMLFSLALFTLFLILAAGSEDIETSGEDGESSICLLYTSDAADE